jgi:hypothetical protein
MVTRKPRLDWIKEVLADSGDCGERARPASLGFAWPPATESAKLQPDLQPNLQPNLQPMNDRPERPKGDDRLFCPSWHLMRLTAAGKS